MEMVIAAGFFCSLRGNVSVCFCAGRSILAKTDRILIPLILAAEGLVEEVKAEILKILAIPCLMTIFRRYLKNGRLEIGGCKCNVSVHRKQRRISIPGSMG